MKVLITYVLYFFYTLIVVHLFIIIRKSLLILFYKEDVANQTEKSFSVIVAAQNEEKNLKELIPLLLKQHYSRYEVILALDRCTDQSFEVAQSYGDERLIILKIDEVPEDFHGKKYALTKAIHKARNEWILLTDADCRPVSGHWVRSFNSKAEDGIEVILGVSPYETSSGVLNNLIRYETFLTAFNYLSAAISGKPYMGVGRNLAYKKELFIRAGGFAGFQHVTGGDDDLFVQTHASRSNTRLNLDMKSLTYSVPKRTWKEYLKQKTRHLSVGKFYRSETKGAHFFNMSVHLLLWLSFLSLVLNYPDQWRIIGIFSLLLLVKGLFFTKVAKKTGITYSVMWYPFVDFLFAVIMPLIGVRAVFVKNIKWS